MKRTWAEYDAEQEELRQREALRQYLERERQPVHVSGKGLLRVVGWVLLWGTVIYILIVMAFA